MKILRAHHVQITIPKGAEEAARRFYCGELGLAEISKPASLAGRGGFWLELDDLQIHVGTEDGIERARSKAHVAYLVDNIENWRAKLESIGLEMIEGIPIPGYVRFEFRDPFGNRIEFLEALSGR